MSIKREQIGAVILAGGAARRMGGGDKTLLPLADKPILQHILDRLNPQCAPILLNANGDAGRFQAFGLATYADAVGGQLGPLAGILTGLDAIALNHRGQGGGITHLISIAGDTPFIPHNLVEKMRLLADGDTIVRASSNGRAHAVCALWPLSIRADLRDQLINQDVRKIDRFTANYNLVDCDFAGIPDPFFNINSPADQAEAERALSLEA